MNKDRGGRGNDVSTKAIDAIAAIGARIRELRGRQGLTLQSLGEKTGLSPSMLSLVERGKTSPSIGTLIVICSALSVHMTELLGKDERAFTTPISRAGDQPVFTSTEGVVRRVLGDDRTRGVEIAINEYDPDTGDSRPLHHTGYEYGICLEGELTIDLDGRQVILRPGDLISYESARGHRIWNHGRKRARTLWVNLNRS